MHCTKAEEVGLTVMSIAGYMHHLLLITFFQKCKLKKEEEKGKEKEKKSTPEAT